MSLFLVGISRQKSEEKTNKTKIAKQRIESCRSVSLSLYISYLSLFTHLSLCLQVTPKTGFSSLMYYSTFPLVTCLVWKSACVCFFFFFVFEFLLLLRLFIINWHVFFNWKGKVTKSANWRTKFTPGLCFKRLGHFPLLLDVLKMIFSSFWERGFFHSWITRHFVSKNLCVLIFVRLLFFIVKLCITFFVFWSTPTWNSLSWAVPYCPPSPNVSHQL